MNSTSTTEKSPVELHQPHWVSRAAFQLIVIALALTEAALCVALVHDWIWLAVPLVLIASHFMHGLLIGFHEASHGMLRTNRRFNEFDGILIGVLSFLPFSLYRSVHQTHHAHLGTKRDEELWPFVDPGTPRSARILAAFFELNVGLLFSPFVFLRAFLRADSPVRSRKVRRRIWAEVALTVAVWTAVFAAVAHWQAWKYLVWLYLVPAFIAANLQSWRKYIEHMGLTGATVNSATRNIVAEGWLGRLVAFTLLHEPYHGVHHLRAGVPHAELPQYVAELQPANPDERAPFPNYRRAFLDLLRGLTDPRIGAQWRAGA